MTLLFLATATAAQPTLSDDDIQVVGDPSASTAVIQISDWRCSHCAVAFPQVRAAVEATLDAQLRFRTFPLGGPCNPDIPSDDPLRCSLGLAAICADETGQFDAFARIAFEVEPWTVRPFSKRRFRRCMDRATTASRLARQIKSAAALDVAGTPTLWLRVDDQWSEVTVDELSEHLPQKSPTTGTLDP